jgi:hypothetical protein
MDTQAILNFLKLVGVSFFLPVGVALATYWAVDKLGEFKKRRDYSRLGVAIIESILEEVDIGISLMTQAWNAAEDNDYSKLPSGTLPHQSWNGMTTIPDEVLLRLIAASASTKRKFESFPPRQCRTHCKNYFMHIKPNYDMIHSASRDLAKSNQDWRLPIHNVLSDEGSHYLQAARGVKRMLEDAKQLLEDNANAKFPK